MTTDLVVSSEERATREQEGALLADQAQGLVVDSAATFQAAGTWLRDVVAPLKRKITETFRPRISQAHELHRGLLADERRFLEPVEAAERLVRGRLAAYEAEQTRARREAEAAAQRERERQEFEARAAAEAATRLRQAEAETQQLEAAAALEAKGDREGAERLLAAPVVAPAVAPAPVFAPAPTEAPLPTVEGVSFRDLWEFEIVDPAQLPRAYLTPDLVAIRGVVKAMRAATSIPGVRVFPRRTTAVRGGR